MPTFDENIEALVQRVAPMLDEIDLENHVPLAYDMDDPMGLNRKNIPERIQKLGALCDQMKITAREHNRLVFLERKAE